MNSLAIIPTKAQAEELLTWAHEHNPGPWADHSRAAARAAQVIAAACGLDTERAYVSGLLHDIGRYEGVRGLHHVIAGYELMRRKGYPAIAEICLSHSFALQDIRAYGGGANDCTPEELAVLETYLSTAVYNEYDRLIQLCDSMCSAQGVCLIDVRLLDVTRRYGFHPLTLADWEAVFALKHHFDALCGKNIYGLFEDEIRRVSIC